jgi:hypothetical protein
VCAYACEASCVLRMRAPGVLAARMRCAHAVHMQVHLRVHMRVY